MPSTLLSGLVAAWATCITSVSVDETKGDRRLAAAETLNGKELLHWRLKALSEIRSGRPDAAVEILQILIADDPTSHWTRTLLALETRRLRLRDPETRRAIPTRAFEVHDPEAAPSEGTALEEWVLTRLPFVPPAQLLFCAGFASGQGRAEDAIGWYVQTLASTPIVDHAFFSAMLSLVVASRDNDVVIPAARRQLEVLTGTRWFGVDDLDWLHDHLAEFLRSRPGDEALEASEALQTRCPGHRFGLAIRLRLASPTYSAAGGEGGWQQTWRAIANGCDHPLDVAAILHRLGTASLMQDETWELGETRLREALALAPEGLLRQRIAGDLLVQWAHRGGHEASWLELLEDRLAQPRASWGPLLAPIEISLQFLSDRGFTETASNAALLLLDRMSDHPFRARTWNVLARVEDDPERAIELFQATLRVSQLTPTYTDPPQIEALESLAALYEEQGHIEESADALARALALSPAPERHFFHASLASYAELFRLRLCTAEPPAEVIDDVLLLLDDGRTVPSGAPDEWLRELFGGIQGPPRELLADRLHERRELLFEQGITPETQRVLHVAEEVSRHPTLQAELCELLGRAKAPDDRTLYEFADAAFESGAPWLGLDVLRRGLRLPALDGPRFTTRMPATLEGRLCRSLEELSPGLDLETLGLVLNRRCNPTRRAALLAWYSSPERSRCPAVERALLTQLECVAAELGHGEEPHARALFTRLSRGEFQVLGACIRLDGKRTADALLAHDTDPRVHAEAIRLLGREQPELSLPPLIECVKRHPEWLEEPSIIKALQRLGAETNHLPPTNGR